VIGGVAEVLDVNVQMQWQMRQLLGL